MAVLTFSKKQVVTWFMGDREVGETTFLPGDELYGEVICREINMPRHQRDPIYIYTVRNLRGQVGVVFAYLDQPIKVRLQEEESDSEKAA